MSILRDVLDTIRDISSMGSVEEIFKRRRYSSISKRSLEGTLQFPVLVSRSMDIDTLQMISKGLERQFSSFVQIALTMSPALDLAKDKDAIGYLRRFHQNTNVKTDLRDVLNLGADVLESYNIYTNADNMQILYIGTLEGATANVVASNREQLQSVADHIRQDILNDKFIPKRDTYRFVNENLNHYHNRVVTEADSADLSIKPKNMNAVSQFVGGDNTVSNTSNFDINHIDNINVEVRGGRLDKMLGKGGGDNRFPEKILRDNDVKKANELVPTTMHVRAKVFNKEGDEQGYLDFIIGIKATMHPIDSQEMVTNIVNAARGNNKFFNFIRWTSGEISFFKDFLFNLKEIKGDVVDRSAGASPWWIALKRRRKLASIKEKLFFPNQILPNASIVVSMEEIEAIKAEYGFDLMNPSFVDKIMKEYFLISFVIVDSSSQIAHFMFDGQTAFQTVTFSALERENTSKADLRETLKIINRANMV